MSKLSIILLLCLVGCTKDGKVAALELGEIKHIKKYTEIQQRKNAIDLEYRIKKDKLIEEEAVLGCKKNNLCKLIKNVKHCTGYGLITHYETFCEKGEFVFRSKY